MVARPLYGHKMVRQLQATELRVPRALPPWTGKVVEVAADNPGQCARETGAASSTGEPSLTRRDPRHSDSKPCAGEMGGWAAQCNFLSGPNEWSQPSYRVLVFPFYFLFFLPFLISRIQI
jgi:hypothetical protein